MMIPRKRKKSKEVAAHRMTKKIQANGPCGACSISIGTASCRSHSALIEIERVRDSANDTGGETESSGKQVSCRTPNILPQAFELARSNSGAERSNSSPVKLSHWKNGRGSLHRKEDATNGRDVIGCHSSGARSCESLLNEALILKGFRKQNKKKISSMLAKTTCVKTLSESVPE